MRRLDLHATRGADRVTEDLHALALKAAAAGADAIRAVARDQLQIKDKGGFEDLVTAADLASERAIISTIHQARPDDRIIAEESGAHPGSGAVCWYVDPLDGTANFVAGSPDYAVSVAAKSGGAVSAAVLYRPSDGAWLGTKSASALHGNVVAAVLSAQPLSQAVVTVSRPHDLARGAEATALRSALLPHIGEERRTGSAACALLLVATGRLAAYISVDLPLWDTAAGHELVERAGGRVAHVRLASGTPVSIAAALWAIPMLTEIIRK